MFFQDMPRLVFIHKGKEHFVILIHQCVVQSNDVIVSAYIYAWMKIWICLIAFLSYSERLSDSWLLSQCDSLPSV